MDIVKIFFWMLAIPAVIAILIALYTIINMVFISDITEFKLKFSPEKSSLKKGVVIAEISNNEKPRSVTEVTTGYLPAAQTMLLHEDKSITKGERVFDADPAQEVLVIMDQMPGRSLVFKHNEVFVFDDFKLGSLVGRYSNPELGIIRHVTPVNEQYILVEGDPATSQHSDPKLWQLNKNTFTKNTVSEDVYYSFVRPPMVFKPGGFNGTVVVYYTGSINYAFGGDSSRPEWSVLRIYTEDYPDGIDIAKFGFKAGTIIDVQWKDEALIVTGDPSLPGMAQQPARAVRVWEVKF
jgi:hypothetical protein